MATVVNYRDLALQATSPRMVTVDLPSTVQIPALKGVSISATSNFFQVNSSGSATPTSITYTATLTQITGTVNWIVSVGTATLSGSTGASVSLSFSNLSSTSATVQASVTDTLTGVVYTKTITVGKVVDAATVVRQSTGYVYYSLSSASAPSTPSASSYNFTSGAFSGLTANWATSFSASTPDTTTKFWASRYTISESSMGGSQTISFTAPFNNIRFDGLVTFTNLSTPGSTTIDGSNIVTGTLTADHIIAGTASDARGSIEMLGFSTVLRVQRTGATTVPALFIFEGDSTNFGTELAYLEGGTANAAAYTVRMVGKNANAITQQVESRGSSSGAAKFLNYAGGFPTTSKEFWAAPGAYAAFSPSGKGKYYFPDGAGPFTGFHPALVEKDSTWTTGDLVVDDEIVHKFDVSNALGTVKLSSQPCETGVLGIVNEVKAITIEFFGEDEDYATWWEHTMAYDLMDVNALGEGMVNVCGRGGDIKKGELIVASSMPGKGMRQPDDLLPDGAGGFKPAQVIQAYTVAKAREDVIFASPDEVKQVACIYLSG